MKEKIRKKLLDSGAVAVGFAKAGKIDSEAEEKYSEWIGEGCHGEMNYLQRHLILRTDPENVLPDSKTVISLAFSYQPPEWRSENLPYIASYAYGDDYHVVLREILAPIVENLKSEYGGSWRICIDSAPLAERYWAMKSGIGKKGLNGSVIIENYGCLCFLLEILTTLEINPDEPSRKTCGECGLCIESCPSNALRKDGTIDSRRCINYLTIEKKCGFTEEEKNILKRGNGYLYGCDKCLRVCPHNCGNIPSTTFFSLRDEIRILTPERILSLSKSEFKKLFNRSPLLYAGYDKLQRNARTLI